MIDVTAVRRVVTGRTPDGRSTTLFDGPSPHLHEPPEYPTFRFTDLWAAAAAPAEVDGDADAAAGPTQLAPPPPGNVFRVVEIAPDPPGWDPRDGFHATDSIDYVYVLSGEIRCLLEDGEVRLRRGDVLVQRATRHAWSNPGPEPCVLLSTMVSAAPPASAYRRTAY